MKSFISSLSAVQAQPPLQKEGLPYWIFWFLLCIILLLVIFIFLRDKDLRRRLSSFLSGARRRLQRLFLQSKLKKERKKKTDLVKELGRKAWGEDISVPGSEKIRGELKILGEKKHLYQMEWNKIFSEMEKANKMLEETMSGYDEKIDIQKAEKLPLEEKMKDVREKEKSLSKEMDEKAREKTRNELKREKESIQKKIDAVDRTMQEIEDDRKDKKRELEKEIREWLKRKERVQEKIRDIEKHQEDFFLSFGKILDAARPEHEELTAFYSQIDAANSAIENLKNQIDTLSQ